LILTDGSFDICWSQFGEVHSPSDAEAFEFVGHRAAVDTELPSEVVQRTTSLVLGSYGCNIRRGQSTLDWFRWMSRNTNCGGGVDAIDVCTERLGAGV
jgi:hypothetical protein